MLRKCSYKRTGTCLLILILILPVDAIRAEASTSSFDSDAQTIKEIIDWSTSAWDYLGKVRTAVEFITGKQPPTGLTIQQIENTIEYVIDRENDRMSIAKVESLAARFHAMVIQIKAVLPPGQSVDSLIGSDFVKTYLADTLAGIHADGTDLLADLGSVLRSPSTRVTDQRVARLMAAYVTLVPLWASSMKLLGEVSPEVKPAQDELISEELVQVQQTLFMAAGAYLLRAYECGNSSISFYSPVGGEIYGWMLSRPLFAYYNPINAHGGGSGFVPPPQFFWQYESENAAKLALNSLESVGSASHSMVWAANAPHWDLFLHLNSASCVLGWITRVRSR